MARRKSRRRSFSGVANNAGKVPLTKGFTKARKFAVEVKVYRDAYGSGNYEARACPKGPANRCGFGSSRSLTGAVKGALAALSRKLK